MIGQGLSDAEYRASLRALVAEHADRFARILLDHEAGCLKVLIVEFILEEARIEACDFLSDWLRGDVDA